jgi:hypothetical protein
MNILENDEVYPSMELEFNEEGLSKHNKKEEHFKQESCLLDREIELNSIFCRNIKLSTSKNSYKKKSYIYASRKLKLICKRLPYQFLLAQGLLYCN